MREFLLEKSANIIKDTSVEPSTDAVNGTLEVNIDPEHYRAIQEQLNSMTNGQGLLEILHQSIAASATTQSTSGSLRVDEDESQLKVSANEGDINPTEVTETNREKLLKKKEKAVLPPEAEGAGEVFDDNEVIGMVKNKGKVRDVSLTQFSSLQQNKKKNKQKQKIQEIGMLLMSSAIDYFLL